MTGRTRDWLVPALAALGWAALDAIHAFRASSGGAASGVAAAWFLVAAVARSLGSGFIVVAPLAVAIVGNVVPRRRSRIAAASLLLSANAIAMFVIEPNALRAGMVQGTPFRFTPDPHTWSALDLAGAALGGRAPDGQALGIEARPEVARVLTFRAFTLGALILVLAPLARQSPLPVPWLGALGIAAAGVLATSLVFGLAAGLGAGPRIATSKLVPAALVAALLGQRAWGASDSPREGASG